MPIEAVGYTSLLISMITLLEPIWWSLLCLLLLSLVFLLSNSSSSDRSTIWAFIAFEPYKTSILYKLPLNLTMTLICIITLILEMGIWDLSKGLRSQKAQLT